jgi:hypothetical protein
MTCSASGKFPVICSWWGTTHEPPQLQATTPELVYRRPEVAADHQSRPSVTGEHGLAVDAGRWILPYVFRLGSPVIPSRSHPCSPFLTYHVAWIALSSTTVQPDDRIKCGVRQTPFCCASARRPGGHSFRSHLILSRSLGLPEAWLTL